MVLRVFAVPHFPLHCQLLFLPFHQNIDDLACVVYKKEISDGSRSQTLAISRIRMAIGQLLKYHPDIIQKVFLCSPVLSSPLS